MTDTRQTTIRPQPSSRRLAALLLAAPDSRLRELVAAGGAELGAREYLEELRWPHGVCCPRCASVRVGWLEERAKHYCRDCRYQFRVTAGTVFHDSHVSLARWLIAIQLIIESEQGFPANKLRAAVGGSYKTAWFLGHRIRSAMSQSLLPLGMPVALASVIAVPAPPLTIPSAMATDTPAAEGWALVKRLVAGAYRRPSVDHLSAYWNEARWRAAHIDDDDVFRRTVVALLAAEPLQYRDLVAHGRPRDLLASLRT